MEVTENSAVWGAGKVQCPSDLSRVCLSMIVSFFFFLSLSPYVNAHNIFIVVLRPGDALVMKELKGWLGLCVEIPVGSCYRGRELGR